MNVIYFKDQLIDCEAIMLKRIIDLRYEEIR